MNFKEYDVANFKMDTLANYNSIVKNFCNEKTKELRGFNIESINILGVNILITFSYFTTKRI